MQQILLVEDDATQAMLARKTLERLDARVVWANSEEDALTILQQLEPDLVVLDWVLQLGSSHSVAEHVRKAFPECPIILWSAVPDEFIRLAPADRTYLVIVDKAQGLSELARVVAQLLRK